MTLHPLVREFAEAFIDSPEDERALFAPPATEEELEAFRVALGLELPACFYDLYRWHNGSYLDGYFHRPLFDGEHLLSLEGILGSKEAFDVNEREGSFDTWEPGGWWHLGWVPFMEIDSWFVVVIDTFGSYGGKPGQIIAFDYKSASDRAIRHPSFEDWLRCMIVYRKQGWISYVEGEEDDLYERFGSGVWDTKDSLLTSISPGYPKNVELWRYRKKEAPPNPHFHDAVASIRADERDKLRTLVLSGKVSPSEQDPYQETMPALLNIAMRAGKWELGLFLLEQGADPTLTNVYGEDASRALLEGLRHTQERSEAIYRILTLLCQQDAVEWHGFVEYSIEKPDLTLLTFCMMCGFDIRQSMRWLPEKNFLHHAVERRAEAGVISWLLDLGVDTTQKDSEGMTPKERFLELNDWFLSLQFRDHVAVQSFKVLLEKFEAYEQQ
ncbi:MAG TPA: hypothetical protein DCE42_11710 [Myxococcales bacterium]|nr:hypothetical protein [Deltaproteobacteria bacterium]HAA55416.1 hypothetical protein [Myxococcales bacterium]